MLTESYRKRLLELAGIISESSDVNKKINEDFFDEKLPSNIKKLSKRYIGRGVTWYGDPNQMIVIHKDYVDGMWGNIYDTDKFNSVVEMIQDSEENVEFECSYALGSVISFTNIKEEQESKYSDRFEIDYEGRKEPASIGDDTLDTYIGNEDYMEEEYSLSSEDIVKFFNKNKFSLTEEMSSVEKLKEEFYSLEYDEDDEYAFDEFIDIETSLKEAVDNEGGDMGDFRIQLRDGHHRVMGAIEAGERYVCVNLDKDDLKRYSDKITKV
jgi:hypothetical protein